MICVLQAIAYRGATYRQFQQDEAASADFNRALEIANEQLQNNPEDFWAIADRGLTYRLMGEFELAIADFDRALALAPGEAYIEEEREKALQGIRD